VRLTRKSRATKHSNHWKGSEQARVCADEVDQNLTLGLKHFVWRIAQSQKAREKGASQHACSERPIVLAWRQSGNDGNKGSWRWLRFIGTKLKQGR
jgi:hypothetical protein